MCGIVGFISNEKVNKININNILNSLHHRGPDEKNYYYEDNVFLGHTRLSIIDIQNSHQPFIEDNYILIFNGEIYNYVELRNELKSFGYQFKTNGDTEVIIKAFKKWGVECFNKFNGMWAIAIYDKKEKKLILSRDRFGKKPLYYYKDKEKIIFASEIKAILKYPNFKKKINYEKLYRYLSFNYRYIDIDESSYFEGIYQIPKSSYMIIDKNVKIYKYWKLKDFNIIQNEAIDEFRELLIDSVRIRLRSDVKVGAYLSGGMDSTSIVSIAKKVLNKDIIAFSGITGDKKGVYDESEYIDEVVKFSNIKHKYLKITPKNLFDEIDEMLDFHDEPICTITWHSLYLIDKEIKKHNIKVVLNGHGGDELLAGYWDHYQYFFYDNNYPGDEIKLWHENHKRDINEIEKYKQIIAKLKQNLNYNRFFDYSYVINEDIKFNIKLDNISSNILTNRMYNELFYETVPASLKAEDRNTMANSIESRSPFLGFFLKKCG